MPKLNNVRTIKKFFNEQDCGRPVTTAEFKALSQAEREALAEQIAADHPECADYTEI